VPKTAVGRKPVFRRYARALNLLGHHLDVCVFLSCFWAPEKGRADPDNLFASVGPASVASEYKKKKYVIIKYKIIHCLSETEERILRL